MDLNKINKIKRIVANIAIILGGVILIAVTFFANYYLVKDHLPVWAWIVSEALLIFCDVTYVRAFIKRFFKKEEKK